MSKTLLRSTQQRTSNFLLSISNGFSTYFYNINLLNPFFDFYFKGSWFGEHIACEPFSSEDFTFFYYSLISGGDNYSFNGDYS